VLPFVLAAGTASSATFLSTYISALRPYLLGVSVLFIALGFYQSRRASQCNCKPSVLSQVILWLSALIVAISILLPQAFADLIERIPMKRRNIGLGLAAFAIFAGLFYLYGGHQTPSGQSPLADLNMTNLNETQE